MTTTAAAAAAAERLRRAANEDAVVVYGTRSSPYPSRKFWGRMEAEEAAKKALAKDEATLADAYIAEHPADDATPLDEARILSFGFEWDGGEVCWILHFKNGDGQQDMLCFYRDCRLTIGGRGAPVRVGTVGQLRSLARVLGISLTGEG